MERRRDERRERDERDECDVRVWAASSRIGSPLGGGVPVRRGGRAAARRAARWSTPRARVHLAGGRRLGRKPCRRVASRAVFTRVRSPPIRCGGTATRPEDRRAWPPTALQPQPRRADTRSAPSLGAPSRVEPPPTVSYDGGRALCRAKLRSVADVTAGWEPMQVSPHRRREAGGGASRMTSPMALAWPSAWRGAVPYPSARARRRVSHRRQDERAPVRVAVQPRSALRSDAPLPLAAR